MNRDDIIFGKTIIDKSSLDIISGSVVDFKKEMIGESFVIDNPKATASCGCGLSFSV
jgi:iron-sulfur cluster insertion protein